MSAGEVSDAAVEAGWAIAPALTSRAAVRNIITAALPHLSPRPDAEVVTGRSLIEAERRRQIEAEGYSVEHDREHGPSPLTRAANCYRRGDRGGWPWEMSYWKPKDHVSNLIRAGALYVAALAVADPDKTHVHLGRNLDGVVAELDAILDKVRSLTAPAPAPVDDREALAEAWDEGRAFGDPYQRRGVPDPADNPYRAGYVKGGQA